MTIHRLASGPVSGSAAHHFVDANTYDDLRVVGVLGQLDRAHSSSEFVLQSACLEQLRLTIEADVAPLSLRVEADDRDLRVAPQVGEMATAGVLRKCGPHDRRDQGGRTARPKTLIRGTLPCHQAAPASSGLMRCV